MREEDYSIENLISIFANHHEKWMDDKKIEQEKVKSGEIEFQDWMKEDFSIALALHTICKEIKKIKDKLI
jgi:hypothetical protein